MDDLYLSDKYHQKNPSYHTEDSAWKAGHILDLLDRHGIVPTTVCEVGCGAGEILATLHARMSDSTTFSGYEISPSAFALCTRLEAARLNFYCENLLEKENVRFDLILCIDVFEHVEDFFGFLRGLNRRGDYKIYRIPLEMAALAVLRGVPLMRAREQVGHIHYFMKETALAALRETGHEIIDSVFYPSDSGTGAPQGIVKRVARLVRRCLGRLNPDLAARVVSGYTLLVLTRKAGPRPDEGSRG